MMNDKLMMKKFLFYVKLIFVNLKIKNCKQFVNIILDLFSVGLPFSECSYYALPKIVTVNILYII